MPRARRAWRCIPINPIASSAAAKVEMHLRVPVHKTPTESLIAKPLAPLEAAAKETDKKIRVKTIKHTDCIEVGHDKFDEVVSNFLVKIGESNMISITTADLHAPGHRHAEAAPDFGVMIVYGQSDGRVAQITRAFEVRARCSHRAASVGEIREKRAKCGIRRSLALWAMLFLMSFEK